MRIKASVELLPVMALERLQVELTVVMSFKAWSLLA